MIKLSSLVRANFKRYKNAFIAVFLLMALTAYPLHIASKHLSAYFLIDSQYRERYDVEVDYDLDIDIYENFFIEDDEKRFTEIIVESIDNAQDEIYIAMYSFNIEEIRDALGDASDRGVKVKIIFNFKFSLNFLEFLGDLSEKFNIIFAGKPALLESHYLMHHKFILVDPDSDNGVLLTGPWNWSHLQEDIDPNILLGISDPEIIDSYHEEVKRLERMEYGQRKFRDFSYVPWDKKIIYPSGEVVEVWWSPGRREYSLQNRINDLILGAEESIDIGMTILNSQSIAKNLVKKAKEGVKIRLIIDQLTIDDEDSIIPELREKIEEQNIKNITIYMGGRVATIENPIYSIFHHHNMIIDEGIVLSGTANWTYGGFYLNDENTLIFYSKKIAKEYKKIFEDYLVTIE